MKTKRVRNEDGITILEVLIAMIILSMSLLLLLNMAMVALDGNDWSHKTTNATQLMQEKLEQLRASTNPTGGVDTVDGVVRTWSVSSASAHLRRALVQVTWEDVKADTHTNSMSTLIKVDSL